MKVSCFKTMVIKIDHVGWGEGEWGEGELEEGELGGKVSWRTVSFCPWHETPLCNMERGHELLYNFGLVFPETAELERLLNS